MSHAPFIRLWPSVREFAADLGIKRSTAKGHLQRGKIPDVDWKRTIDGAQRRGFGHLVTYDALAEACARQTNQHPISRGGCCGGGSVASLGAASPAHCEPEAA